MIQRTCPSCGARVRPPREDDGSFPFCSARCRTIDLGKWLDERYRIPDEAVTDTAWPGQHGWAGEE